MMSTEQELADALSHNIDNLIDNLMSGAATPEHDPLLDIARLLSSDQVQPSRAALARFEQQLGQWFPPRPPLPLNWRRILPALILVIIALILLALSVFGTPQAAIPTSIPASSTPPVTLPGTAATTTFVRVVISGAVAKIEGSTLTVLGKTIVIDGAVVRICAGDAIRIEATLASDGSLHADAKHIKVEASTCSSQPQSADGGMGNMGDGD